MDQHPLYKQTIRREGPCFQRIVSLYKGRTGRESAPVRPHGAMADIVPVQDAGHSCSTTKRNRCSTVITCLCHENVAVFDVSFDGDCVIVSVNDR